MRRYRRRKSRLPENSKLRSAVSGGRLDDPRAVGDSWEGEEQNPSREMHRRGRKKKIGPGRKTHELPPCDLGAPAVVDVGRWVREDRLVVARQSVAG